MNAAKVFGFDRDRTGPRSAARAETEIRTRGATLVAALAPILVFGAIAARRWWQVGDFVSGLDPGAWFALGRQYVGAGDRTTAAAYSPLVPVLLHGLRTVADPMVAAKLVSLGSLLAVAVAAYVVARHGLDRWFALAAASTIGLAHLLTETVAFGGYPQNYAVAFLVLSAFAMALALERPSRRRLLFLAGALCGGALSHHMYFLVTCLVAALVWVIWLTTSPPAAALIRGTGGVAIAGAASLVCYVPTALALRGAGYDPPINAASIAWQPAFRHGIREAPWLWSAAFVVAVVFLAVRVRSRRCVLWQVSAAMMSAAVVLFRLTSELRLLPPLLIGATLASMLALSALRQRWAGSPWGLLPLAAALLCPVVLWPRSDANAALHFRYYRVADESLVAAARYVEDHHGDGLVVVRQDRRGWPLGWWFEGLTDAKIAVGSNEQWLAFPAERDHARLASLFFQRLTGQEVAALAERHGVESLVLRKWDWIGWERWLAEPSPTVEVLYDDDEFLVLDVVPEPRAPALAGYQPSASRE